jgi:hypothetical protein
MTMLQTRTKNKKPDTVICDKQKAVSGSIYSYIPAGKIILRLLADEDVS